MLSIISGEKNAFKRLLESCRSDPDSGWKDCWRRLITDYSACQLGRDDDKWSAFRGWGRESNDNPAINYLMDSEEVTYEGSSFGKKSDQRKRKHASSMVLMRRRI